MSWPITFALGADCTEPSRSDLDDEQMMAKLAGQGGGVSLSSTKSIGSPRPCCAYNSTRSDAMEWQPAQDFTLLIMREAGRDIRGGTPSPDRITTRSRSTFTCHGQA